jgi:hypothetical protein
MKLLHKEFYEIIEQQIIIQIWKQLLKLQKKEMKVIEKGIRIYIE